MAIEGHYNPVAWYANLNQRRKIERCCECCADLGRKALALRGAAMLFDDPPRVDLAREFALAAVIQTNWHIRATLLFRKEQRPLF
jgi:hypothetical protein